MTAPPAPMSFPIPHPRPDDILEGDVEQSDNFMAHTDKLLAELLREMLHDVRDRAEQQGPFTQPPPGGMSGGLGSPDAAYVPPHQADNGYSRARRVLRYWSRPLIIITTAPAGGLVFVAYLTHRAIFWIIMILALIFWGLFHAPDIWELLLSLIA